MVDCATIINLGFNSALTPSIFSLEIWRNNIPCIFSWQNDMMDDTLRICSAYGLCKLARAVGLLTVAPMPSHDDLLWLVAKKGPAAWSLPCVCTDLTCFYNSCTGQHKLLNCMQLQQILAVELNNCYSVAQWLERRTGITGPQVQVQPEGFSLYFRNCSRFDIKIVYR